MRIPAARLVPVRSLALSVVCVGLLACQTATEPEPAIVESPPAPRLPHGDPEPMGLIVVTVDTLRADYLSCYGHARILTPSFDRLASGGVLFWKAVSQATTTTPSHASIFTSLYLQDHNVYSNFEALGTQPRTMAEILVGRGFETYANVNMRHLNPEVSGLGQGFKTFVRSGGRRATANVDNFLGWLDSRQDKKFFAWLHLSDVHTPYSPPPPYDRFYYDDDERDPGKRSLQRIWPTLPTHLSDHPFFQQWLSGITDLDWVLAQYQGSVTYVDDEIGRLIDALEERDLLGKTAIVITADHGESLGEHDMYFVHTGLYEPTVHVPLITYFPGAGRQGVHVKDIVESVDIMPTALEYLSVPAPRGIRGRSLWPLIRGEVQPPRIAFSEHAGRNMAMLRSERYKYIKHLRTMLVQPSYPFIDGREELYDLKADPLERKDISAQATDMVRVFRKELVQRRSERLAMATGEAELTQETLEVLRALGYVR